MSLINKLIEIIDKNILLKTKPLYIINNYNSSLIRFPDVTKFLFKLNDIEIFFNLYYNEDEIGYITILVRDINTDERYQTYISYPYLDCKLVDVWIKWWNLK